MNICIFFNFVGEIKPHLAPVPTIQNNATLTLKRARASKATEAVQVQSKAR